MPRKSEARSELELIIAGGEALIRNLFEAFLYTVVTHSQTEHEPQGGEKSERRSSTISTVRLCRLGAKLAHKGRWHHE